MTALKILLTVLIGFFIPLSTVLTNIFCGLAVLLLLAERDYYQQWQRLKAHPVALIALALFSLMLLGCLYTTVPVTTAFLMLDKYRELLYLPLFILWFRDPLTRQLGLAAFMAAMGLTLILSYGMAVTGWDFLGKGTAENPFIFKNHITQGTLMALAAYFLAVYAFQTQRYYWLIGVFLAVYNVIFMIQGRTGYLVLICLVLLFCYQAYRLRGLLIGMMALSLFSLLVYNGSDIFRTRIDKVATGVETYQQGQASGSIATRITFLKNSLILIAQHPILGTGTGSFAHEYQLLAAHQGTQPTTNPHNEYFMIAIQWGLIGTGLFLYLFYQIGRLASQLDTAQAWMTHGLVVAIAVGCLFNSLLLDNTEGHLFVFLTGVFLGGIMHKTAKRCWGISMMGQRCQAHSETTGAIGPYFCSRHQSQVILLFILLLVVYHAVNLSREPLTSQQTAKTPALSLTQPVIDAITQAITHPGSINTQVAFQTQVKTSQTLRLTVSLSDPINLSTQIEVEPQYVGRAARTILLATYRASPDAPTVLLQRQGDIWVTATDLQALAYYTHLPNSITLPIYQGRLKSPGYITVLAGYILEDDTFVIHNAVAELTINP